MSLRRSQSGGDEPDTPVTPARRTSARLAGKVHCNNLLFPMFPGFPCLLYARFTMSTVKVQILYFEKIGNIHHQTAASPSRCETPSRRQRQRAIEAVLREVCYCFSDLFLFFLVDLTLVRACENPRNASFVTRNAPN